MKNKETMRTSPKLAFYRRYQAMKYRCENQNDSSYKYYGGKGIKNEWASFEHFKKEMENSFLDHVSQYGLTNTTLDRIDSNKNYSKENCRWATRSVQGKNTNRVHLIKYKGKTDSILGWSNILGLSHSTILRRLYKYKWTVDKTLSTPAPGINRSKQGRFTLIN